MITGGENKLKNKADFPFLFSTRRFEKNENGVMGRHVHLVKERIIVLVAAHEPRLLCLVAG